MKAEVVVGRSQVSQEETYRACKFLYAGICIKEHASSRSGCCFCGWLFEWQSERIDQRYTEEGLIGACVVVESISFLCTIAKRDSFLSVAEEAYHQPPPFYYKLFRHNGKGSPRQQHFEAIFWRGWCGGVAKKGQACGQTSACGWCRQLPAIVPGGRCSGSLYGNQNQKDISLIKAWLKEAFMDGAFMAYRKLTMVRWAGERVDIYANKIRQLARLAGFEGAGL